MMVKRAALLCLLASAAILSGCGTPAPEANQSAANGATAAAPVGAAPAVPAASAPVAAGAVPRAFHGVYDRSVEACARPSEYRLTVSAKELRFHESIGTVRAVTIEGPDAVRVEADYQGEGESWSSVQPLSLSDGGARLTIAGPGEPIVRVRC